MSMRAKEQRLVVTFRTTAGAMAMEKLCHEHKLPGRLIPVPRAITAGCGMCWSAPPESREVLEDLVMAEHLPADGFYDMLL
jgi:hypothetical protein